jgi:Beta-ketoacyl synthase, N-terminal domain
MSSPRFPLFPVAVIGQGAVSPAGEGVPALLTEEAIPDVALPSLRAPESKSYPVRRVDPKWPGLKKWALEPRLRRASAVPLYLIEAATQALAGWSRPAGARLGLVGAFFCGCPAYSRRFFEQTIRQGQVAASPALFPETVYNSPLSHTASILGINGAVYAVVGDDTAWAGALRVAATWLALDEVDAVVVVAGEEIDIIPVEAYAAARWLRAAKPFRPAEGAAAVLLRRPETGDNCHRIEAIHGGRSYRSANGARGAARACLAEFFPQLPVFPTAGHSWLEPLAQDTAGKRQGAFVGSYLGEAFVASAGWNLLRALSPAARPPSGHEWIVPIWGQNQQISALKVARA